MFSVTKKKSPKVTKVFIDMYNGRPTFAIWEVDPAGNKVSMVPVISFGQGKAEFVLRHIEELKDFLEIVE